MTDNTKLLPCPFCGGPGKLCVADYVHDDGRPWPIVECDNCHGWVPADAWNTRAPAEDVREVVEELVYQVRSHGSCCWEDISGESLEVCRCQPEEYEIRTLYRHPQRPVASEDETLFQKGQRLAKEGHGLSNLWGNCAKDSEMDEVQRGMEAYWLDAVEELNK